MLKLVNPSLRSKVGSNTSLFTRATDPHNPRRVSEILKQVAIGPDLSEEQRSRACSLITEFADCFALSVRKVLPIPGAKHHIHIPAGVTFPKKIPPPATSYHSANMLISVGPQTSYLAADIIEPIQPEDVKCVSPLTHSQKVHGKTGLSLHEIQHRVNEECIANRYPPPHNVDAPSNTSPNEPQTKATEMVYDPTQPQKWCICQDYGALNRVTHVFPTPQGDIRTKQRNLSGHQWVHGFDFASGFYAVAIPEAIWSLPCLLC